MREIDASLIIETVKKLCISTNINLPKDVCQSIKDAYNLEPFAPAKNILGNIIKNIEIANEKQVPLCQDTGMASVFLEIGQDVHITGMPLYDAINEGVRQGYEKGYLRKSVVKDPLNRVNTKDNTPALINIEIVQGEQIKITIAPKGFGSENMSRVKMLAPSDGVEGIKKFVVETVQLADANPCPPVVLGVGIGGSFDKVALLAKKALLRDFSVPNKSEYYAALENELLDLVNQTGIGPQGFGGKTTALKVNIETFPTHIAALPVAVNVSCHVTRYKSEVI